jgi:hypothetical protein
MRTQRVIGGIVAGFAVLAVAAAAVLIAVFGAAVGVMSSAGVALIVAIAYRSIVGPWQRRWGATDDEANRLMPGDEIVSDAQVTTRAIDIDAPPERVWPWLIQLGYGRAGWYSYDWIDNDGLPSADDVIPAYQNLRLGDQLTMIPGMGPMVRVIDPLRMILAGDEISGTWCLQLHKSDSGTRLISRWRMPPANSLPARCWMFIADPGAFIMERKMLLGIRHRAEHLHAHKGERQNEPATGRGSASGHADS